MTRRNCPQSPAAPVPDVVRRAGFTMLEIIIAVGVVVLLAAISVIGFRVVGGASKGKVTQVQLAVCKTLLSEFENTTSLPRLLDSSLVEDIVANNRWESDAGVGLKDVTVCRVVAPDLQRGSTAVITNQDQRAANDRMLRDETARVIKRLTTVAANRQMVEAMSSEKIVKVRYPNQANLNKVPTGSPSDYPPGVTWLIDGVNLLDGFGHPIYFIPGGGLVQVNFGYKGTGDIGDPANYDQPNQRIASPDGRPFWASPGPDGNLSSGDDNVYSFSN